MTHDYEEKRSFARMQLETEVQFKIKGEAMPHTAISQDLSATGLLMHSSFAPPLGCELEIEMHTDNPRLPPFIAIGEVLRVQDNLPSAGRYLISVSLTDSH
jgi:hypothetical protein